MKIIELVAENFRKLRVVEINPGGQPVVKVTGRNGQGKTSVIDSIWFGLKGQKTLPDRKTDVVRRGSERMKVTVKVGEDGGKETFTIVRTLGMEGNPPTLTITPAVHKEAQKTPQEYLDDLFGALTFDPLAFAHMSTADQVAELKKTAKLDIDFEQLAAEDETDYNERTAVNREVKLLEGQLAGMTVLEGLPKSKIDTASLTAAIEKAAETNRQAQAVFQARQELGATAARIGLEKTEADRLITTRETEITSLEKQLAAARTALEKAKTDRDATEKRRQAAELAFQSAPAGDLVDVGALSQELQSAERTNRAIDERARYDSLKAQKDEKTRKAAQLTRAMEQRAEKKRAALANAKIPVDGLIFDEQRVTYRGIPIDQLGEGEQIRISTLIGMAANPKLRILCIRHGEALDEDGLKQLAAIAKEHDFQIWMARVDSTGKVGIVLEDGMVKARNEEED